MHKLLFILVCGVIVCPAALAERQPTFYFGKPNVSDEEFRRDESACGRNATAPRWGTARVPVEPYLGPSVPPTGGPPQVRGGGTVTTLDYTPNPSAFVQCMLAKGYKQGLPPIPPGKPGLYEFHKLSPAQPAQDYQLCVPRDGDKLLTYMMGLNPSCTYSNVMDAPHGFTADAICQGNQSLHVAFELSTADHREFTVTRQATPSAPARTDKLQINWMSSDCGGIPPGNLRTPDGRIVPATP